MIWGFGRWFFIHACFGEGGDGDSSGKINGSPLRA